MKLPGNLQKVSCDMRSINWKIPLLALGLLGGCASVEPESTVKPLDGLDGIYVGKVPVLYNLMREEDVPLRSVLMPDGKTWVVTMQLLNGSVSSTARGGFVTPTKWIGTLKEQKVLFTTISEDLRMEVEFAEDGRSAKTTSTTRGVREPIIEQIYKVGTPEAARIERQFPAMHAKLQKSRDVRSLTLSKYYIANYTTGTSEEIRRSLLFYGPMVAKVHPPNVFLYAFGGYGPTGEALINFGRAPIIVPMSEVGLRRDNEIIEVPKDNPVVISKPGVGNQGIFAKAPLLR